MFKNKLTLFGTCLWMSNPRRIFLGWAFFFLNIPLTWEDGVHFLLLSFSLVFQWRDNTGLTQGTRMASPLLGGKRVPQWGWCYCLQRGAAGGKSSLFFQRQPDLFPLPIHLLVELLLVPGPALPTPHLVGHLSHELRAGEAGEDGFAKIWTHFALGILREKESPELTGATNPSAVWFPWRTNSFGSFVFLFRLKILPRPKEKVSGNTMNQQPFQCPWLVGQTNSAFTWR